MHKRRFTALLTAMLLLFVQTSVWADKIFDDVTEQTLFQGLTYKNIKRLTTDGWQDIHIVEADMNEPHLKFKVLTDPQGVSHMTNVLNFAKDNDAVAAVNGDFFARKSGTSDRGSAVGVTIVDGELLSTPSTEAGTNAFYQLKDGAFGFNLFSYDITITAPNGNTDKIKHINKYDNLTGIVMYTRDWNNITIDKEYNMVNVVVVDGIVTQIRHGMPPVDIPENGYVLTCLKDYNTFLIDNFQEGDPITIDIQTTPNYQAIETALGGGGYLVTEGKVPSRFSHNIAGTHPRTAIGLDQSGKKLFLVAVDGRQSQARGMSQTEMGQLMVELGCYTALNLDGGGSTTMVIKPDGGEHEVVNSPSDGSLRNVVNSAAITLELEDPVMMGVKMQADDTRLFAGTSRWVWLEGVDQYGRKMDIPQEEVTWSVDGGGTVTDGMFYPDGVGTVTITGRYQGMVDTKELQVVEKPYSMYFSSEELHMSTGGQETLFLYGKEENGYQVLMYPKDVNIEIQNGLGQMNGNKLTALASGSGLVTAQLGETTAHMALYVDTEGSIEVPDGYQLPDQLERHAELNGAENSFRFTVFGNTREPQNLYDIHIQQRLISQMRANGEKFGFVGGELSQDVMNALDGDYFRAENYNIFTHKGSTFISLNNSQGTLYGSDAKQWQWFEQDIANVTGNLFIFLNNDNITDNPTELKHFTEVVEGAAARGANVFVFMHSWGNFTTVTNDVRYIHTAGVFDTVNLRGPATIYNVKYYAVTVNGSDVTYELKSIMDGAE